MGITRLKVSQDLVLLFEIFLRRIKLKEVFKNDQHLVKVWVRKWRQVIRFTTIK